VWKPSLKIFRLDSLLRTLRFLSLTCLSLFADKCWYRSIFPLSFISNSKRLLSSLTDRNWIVFENHNHKILIVVICHQRSSHVLTKTLTTLHHHFPYQSSVTFLCRRSFNVIAFLPKLALPFGSFYVCDLCALSHIHQAQEAWCKWTVNKCETKSTFKLTLYVVVSSKKPAN